MEDKIAEAFISQVVEMDREQRTNAAASIAAFNKAEADKDQRIKDIGLTTLRMFLEA